MIVILGYLVSFVFVLSVPMFFVALVLHDKDRFEENPYFINTKGGGDKTIDFARNYDKSA